MRKLLGILAIVSVLGVGLGSAAADTFTPQAGRYIGEITKIVETPAMCNPDLIAGGIRDVSFLDANTVQIVTSIDFDGVEIPVWIDICPMSGVTMRCDEGEDQVFDFSDWGLDAVWYNPVHDGIYVWDSATSFSKISSAQHTTCDGADCDILAEMLEGPGYSYPCNLPPAKTVYTKAQ